MKPNRREFIRVATLAAAAFALSCKKEEEPEAPVDTAVAPIPPICAEHDDIGELPDDEATDLPHLGGAPNTPEGRAIAAFVDVVIPGRHRDPIGAPGGIDVGAPALFFDPELPALEFVGLLVGFIDAIANTQAGTTFAALSPDERDVAVQTAIDAFDLMEFAVQMAKLAYFSSEGAHCHLGYPGANPGYFADPELTFGEALADEITADGTYP